METIQAIQEISAGNEVPVVLTVNRVDNTVLIQSNIPVSGILKIELTNEVRELVAMLDLNDTRQPESDLRHKAREVIALLGDEWENAHKHLELDLFALLERNDRDVAKVVSIVRERCDEVRTLQGR